MTLCVCARAQIEVGRPCEAEILVCNQLRALDTAAIELDARRSAALEKGRSTYTQDRKLRTLAETLQKRQKKLEELWDAPDECASRGVQPAGLGRGRG